MVIVADELGVEVAVVGRLQALSQASCLGTPCTAHFLPACLLKNAQLHSPSANNLAQSTQTAPETDRQDEHFIPSTLSHFLTHSSR